MQSVKINRLNDYAFKRIFGSPESKEVLLGLLNAILQPSPGEELIDLKYVDRELAPEFMEGKGARLDILAKTPGDEWYSIEVQIANQYNIDKRLLYYWSRIYSRQLTSGETYTTLKKTVVISILAFHWFSSTERFHRKFQVRDSETYEVLSDHLEIHLLEMPKFRRYGKNMPRNALVRWMLYLGNIGGKELEQIAMEDPAIQKAINIEEIFAKDEQERYYYEMREKYLHDVTSMLDGAKEEGKAEGRAEGKADLLIRQLRKRFGKLSSETEKRLLAQDSKTLDQIGEALLDLANVNELENFLH